MFSYRAFLAVLNEINLKTSAAEEYTSSQLILFDEIENKIDQPNDPLEDDATLHELVKSILERNHLKYTDFKNFLLEEFSPYLMKELLQLQNNDMCSIFRGSVLADRACGIHKKRANTVFILCLLEFRLAKRDYEKIIDWSLKYRGQNRLIPFGFPTKAQSFSEWQEEKRSRSNQIRLRCEQAEHDLLIMRTLSSQDGRICPQPIFWSELFQLLPRRYQSRPGALTLRNPLILGGWHLSTDAEKKERLDEHLQWACKYGVNKEVLEYLQSLSNDQWYNGNNF